MLRYLLLCHLLGAYFVTAILIVNPGPKYPATKGEVWPKPQQENKEKIYFTYDPSTFHIKVTSQTCSILTNAIQRYIHIFNAFYEISKRNQKRNGTMHRNNVQNASCFKVQDNHYQGLLTELEIDLDKPCEEYPYFEMDENYELLVAQKSKLKTLSIWGALRGLETFSHLFYLSNDATNKPYAKFYDDTVKVLGTLAERGAIRIHWPAKEVRINATKIIDFPSYPHRGLLIDTGRHYISVQNILLTLDAMTANKMNVLHWHIVDDQSFPFQSEKLPNLSRLGAYHSTMIYTKQDVQNIINYARDRGIRVVPEFDVPGHTASWGVAYPKVLTNCYQYFSFVGLGPMNPIKNNTYDLLRDLFEEIQTLFPDKFIHVGGDEVDLSCWTSNPELLYYMMQKNMSSVTDLHALFMENTIPLLLNRSTPIVWQEVFDDNVELPEDTLVQVWKNGPKKEMLEILKAGYRVLFSSSWYLDQLCKDDAGRWIDYYLADPRTMVNNSALDKNIVGGEACMWGEMVDDRNIISRVWPRTSAIAERLWSAQMPLQPLTQDLNDDISIPDIPEEVYHRLEEHTCRMLRRGIASEPSSGPGFCVVS